MSDLSQKIKTLRVRLGLGQKEFAAAVGVTQGTVSKWENGSQKPEAEPLARLSQMAGLDLVEFALGDEGRIYKETRKISTIPVVGYVQKGEFRDSPFFPRGETYSIRIPVPVEADISLCEGFEVRGEFSNQLFPDGTIVIFQAIKDHSELQGREVVYVETVYKDGKTDFSVWLCLTDDSRTILTSRSLNKDLFEMYYFHPSKQNDPNVKFRAIRSFAIASVRIERDGKGEARREFADE